MARRDLSVSIGTIDPQLYRGETLPIHVHAEMIGNIQNDIIHIFAKLFIYGLPSSSEVINVPASKRSNQRTLAIVAAKKESCRERLIEVV